MAQKQDLTIDQGSRFQLVVTVTGPDLTGYTAQMMVRSRRTDTVILTDFSSKVSVSGGQVIVDIDSATTGALTWDSGVYDILVSKSSQPSYRVLEGRISVDRSVTR